MRKEEDPYEDRVIAFLDILGAEELIKNKNPSIFNAITLLSDFQKTNKSNFEIAVFSDTIVISFRFSEKDKENLENLRNLIFNITLGLCASLFFEEVLLRGSITRGELYHKGNAITGPALVAAHKIESKIAFYPRIILSREIEDLVNKNDAPSTKDVVFHDGKRLGSIPITDNYSSTLPIRVSDDGYSYLHWLHWHLEQRVEESSQGNIPIVSYQPNLDWIENVKNIIEKNMTNLKENSGPYGKWRWMAVYFNQVLAELNVISSLIDIRAIKKKSP